MDIIYHSNVRWLSRCKVLVRLLTLRSKIILFYERNNQRCHLSDTNFLVNASFLSDLLKHENNQNIALQGDKKFFFPAWHLIKQQKAKLDFFSEIIHTGLNLEIHFPKLDEILKEKNVKNYPKEKFKMIINSLKSEYDRRFHDFAEQEQNFMLVTEPHLVNPLNIALFFNSTLSKLNLMIL